MNGAPVPLMPRKETMSALTVLAFSLALPALASADPPTGWGIGPRVQHHNPGIGVDYWTEHFGFSIDVGGGYGRYDTSNVSDGDFSETDGSSRGLYGAVGVFGALTEGASARLALGLRFRVASHESSHEDGGFETESSMLELAVPLRLQWAATDRIVLHTEMGLAVQRSNWTYSSVANDGSEYGRDDDGWDLVTFASPVANLGVSYFF